MVNKWQIRSEQIYVERARVSIHKGVRGGARGYGVRARGYGVRARGYGVGARGYGTLVIIVSPQSQLDLDLDF